jgi:hypothetical protein
MSRDVSQLLLPFAEREYIDVPRTAKILGVGCTTVFDLFAAKRIEIIDYAPRKHKRVRYASVVALCDRLRADYGIADRRPALASPIFRHRDEDLLPFPLSDTMLMRDVLPILGYEVSDAVVRMIDQGFFEAYKISRSSPWRISRTSLAGYLQGVYDRAKMGPADGDAVA